MPEVRCIICPTVFDTLGQVVNQKVQCPECLTEFRIQADDFISPD